MSDRSTLFGLKAFHAWVEKQPPEETYGYFDCYDCAYAQYLKSLGFTGIRVNSNAFRVDGSLSKDLPAGLDACVGLIPHTFGALAERLARRV